jgi:hypothetical protein
MTTCRIRANIFDLPGLLRGISLERIHVMSPQPPPALAPASVPPIVTLTTPKLRNTAVTRRVSPSTVRVGLNTCGENVHTTLPENAPACDEVLLPHDTDARA